VSTERAGATKPQRARAGARAKQIDPPIDLSEQDGVRHLHFGSVWIQGAMRIRRPFDIELDYVRNMMAWLLFMAPPQKVLQLGLGAAALTKWCWRFLPHTRVTAVEASPGVIAACHQWFALPPPDERLRLVCADAGEFVARPGERGVYGVIQVDVYDRDARGPVLDSLEFYRDCRRCLASPGMLVLNLFGGDQRSFTENLERVIEVFDSQVLVLPPVAAGNLVVLAFSGPPLSVDSDDLFARADYLKKQWRLPGPDWAKALRHAIPGV
jgi:spermidine synthase